MKNYKRILLQIFIISFSFCGYAQDCPIGYWQSHMPYNVAMGVATDGMTLYVICEQSLYTVSKDGEINTYSKVEGMADVGMAEVAYDAGTSTTILAYQNSNIDLFKDNTFYNIPYLKNEVVSGSKSVNHIYTEAGFAYLSTDIGILVLDLDNKDVSNSYIFYLNKQVVPVKAFCASGKYFYAATPKGIFRADKNNPQLQNFAVWERFDSLHSFNYLANVDSTLFAASGSNLYTLHNGSFLQLTYTTNKSIINHLDPVNDGVWITEYYDTAYRGIAKKMSPELQFIDSFNIKGKGHQITETQDKSAWIADEFYGFRKREGTDLISYRPECPNAPTSFDIYAKNREAWIAYGGFTDRLLPLYNKKGFSELKDNDWTHFCYQEEFQYDSVRDFIAITKDPTDGTIYAGSFVDGLFVLHPDGSTQLINKNVFDQSTTSNAYQIVGLAFDNNNNLWVTMVTSYNELYVKTKAGDWYKFHLPYQRNVPYAGGPIVVDGSNKKWYVCSYGGGGGGGIIVYDDNNTPEEPGDDQSRNLTVGQGYGNLPSNRTYCVACDKNDDIWVGTDNGIGIINCGGSVFEGCDAQIPIVQYDQYAGYLFAGENVRTIAVDGANRKWVGTDNGVWLLSPDASKIVYRFTITNSPLPSNHIEKITVDGVTGDVYIGTEQGLIVYRSTATDGGTTNSNVKTYPNPVPSGYKGTIAIKGLVANADVRITDVSGQLVYRTTALGGQAIWNGIDYTGHRPQSGVYLIFVTNSNGTETYVSKMVFLQ